MKRLLLFAALFVSQQELAVDLECKNSGDQDYYLLGAKEVCQQLTANGVKPPDSVTINGESYRLK